MEQVLHFLKIILQSQSGDGSVIDSEGALNAGLFNIYNFMDRFAGFDFFIGGIITSA